MPSRSAILSALQYPLFNRLDPINTASDARYTITFQYAGTSQPGDLPTATTYTGWRDFTAAEKAAFRSALDHIETFLNVTFVEVTGDSDPDINVGAVDIPGATAGWGGYSASYSGNSFSRWDGYVVYDNTFDLSLHSQINLLLHELGHALGLRHPFGTAEALPAEFDNNRYTVMSYTDNPDNGLGSDAMMLYDLLALQDIWGGAGFNAGRTVYTGSRTGTVDVIWDTGGKDRLDARDHDTAVTLDLRAGRFSSFDASNDVTIAYGTRIENATGGSAGDRIIGNGKANTLNGRGGDDSLVGKGGTDVLLGGGGRDTLKGDAGRDSLMGGNDADTLRGGGGRDRLDGQRGDDILFGNGGADKFLFRAGHGADTVADFQDDTDKLRIIGHGSKSEVLATAHDIGGDAVFDFGAGHSLTVTGLTVAALTDDLLV